MDAPLRNRRAARGFSLVELLVAIVLAVIVLGAMVPLFVHVLKRTSADELRVDATNIAQDRIEQTRLLAWADITSTNLNTTSTTFGDGRFGPTYTLVGESRPYSITYVVDPPASDSAPQKHITVNVSRPGPDGFVTTADTIIQNPAAGESTSTEAEPTNLSMTVWFDNWAYVKSPGVVIVRVQTNVTPNVTTTPAPGYQMPSAGHQELTWSGLTGGPNYTYRITCHSSKATYPLNAPPFRLWSNGRLKFDTYPGGD